MPRPCLYCNQAYAMPGDMFCRRCDEVIDPRLSQDTSAEDRQIYLDSRTCEQGLAPLNIEALSDSVAI